MDRRPQDYRSVANYILLVRRHFGLSTSNLEIQKLAFFCYANFAIKRNEKLFDGYFEAWEHGPVHPPLYKEFKRYGKGPIPELIKGTDIVTGATRTIRPPSDTDVRSHVAEVILSLKGLSAWQLRDLSHRPGGAWDRVYNSAKVNLASSIVIPDSVIREDRNRHISVANQTPVGEEIAYEDHPPKPYRTR